MTTARYTILECPGFWLVRDTADGHDMASCPRLADAEQIAASLNALNAAPALVAALTRFLESHQCGPWANRVCECGPCCEARAALDAYRATR